MRVTRKEVVNMLAAAAPAAGLPVGQSTASAKALMPQSSTESSRDWRNIVTGAEIPRENYSDQPYVVITRDGNWLCVLTTGSGIEGRQGQRADEEVKAERFHRGLRSRINVSPSSCVRVSKIGSSGRRLISYKRIPMRLTRK